MDSLFHQCSQLQGAPQYFLFLSLLSLALLNYLRSVPTSAFGGGGMVVCVCRVVESWVFHGTLDTNQRIGIETDGAALDKRGEFCTFMQFREMIPTLQMTVTGQAATAPLHPAHQPSSLTLVSPYSTVARLSTCCISANLMYVYMSVSVSV